MFVARGGVVLRGDGGEDCGEEDDRCRPGCAVGSLRTEAVTSGIWKKKRTLPLILPPCDGASGIIDDGGDGDGDEDDDGIARSEGGIVASIVAVIDDNTATTTTTMATTTMTTTRWRRPERGGDRRERRRCR